MNTWVDGSCCVMDRPPLRGGPVPLLTLIRNKQLSTWTAGWVNLGMEEEPSTSFETVRAEWNALRAEKEPLTFVTHLNYIEDHVRFTEKWHFETGTGHVFACAFAAVSPGWNSGLKCYSWWDFALGLLDFHLGPQQICILLLISSSGAAEGLTLATVIPNALIRLLRHVWLAWNHIPIHI